MLRLSTNSSDINIFTQSKHDYKQALKIVLIKSNLFLESQIKHPMYVIGGRISQGKFYGLRRHIIWLLLINYGRNSFD